MADGDVGEKAVSVSEPSLPQRVEIGVVGRAHGLRGEVKVRLHWEEGETLRAGVSLAAATPSGERELTIGAQRRAGKVRIVQFVGVTDRTLAEALTGARLSVPRDRLPKLEPGEYYLCDLVGARVEAPEGMLGTVVAVEVYPGADTLVIELQGGERVLQVLGAPSVESVDAAGGLIKLSSTDGLI